ncbi:hypothetical protein BC829DRAFT_180574 [Chytridium lagenaria]|nr:hypothetical protein BC829DRAFT_180574 [Chytridium lagenaria]
MFPLHGADSIISKQRKYQKLDMRIQIDRGTFKETNTKTYNPINYLSGNISLFELGVVPISACIQSCRLFRFLRVKLGSELLYANFKPHHILYSLLIVSPSVILVIYTLAYSPKRSM